MASGQHLIPAMLRVLFAGLILVGGLASAAPKKQKSPPPPKVAPTPTPAPESKPSVSAAAPNRLDERPFRITGALGVGGFLAGGVNRGLSGTAQLTFNHPGLGKFAFDAELGWRLAQFGVSVPDYGRLTSSFHSFPLYLAGRVEIFRRKAITVDIRGGGGPMFVIHQLSSDFASSVTRTSLGWELFAGAQARVPVSTFELFADVRWGFGEAFIPVVIGRATGFAAFLGARYVIR